MTLKSIDLFILNISNKNRDNYTLVEGKRATSCVANPFWMAKLILLNKTF
jgi:hypothetical protein